MIEKPTSTPEESQGEAGFTLAELLVALALLAVVLGLASGGMRFGVRAWEATRAIDRNAELAATRDLISACLKSAAPVSSIDEEGRIAVAFHGAHDHLSLVCPLGRLSNTYRRLALHLDRNTAAHALVATIEPFQRRRRSRQPAPEAQTHLLAGDVTSLEIRYFGDLGDGAGPKFHDQWTHPGRLPGLVAIAVRFAGSDRRVWPVLSIAIESRGS